MSTDITIESSKRCLVAPERYAELQSNTGIMSKKDSMRNDLGSKSSSLPTKWEYVCSFLLSCKTFVAKSAALLSFDILVHFA